MNVLTAIFSILKDFWIFQDARATILQSYDGYSTAFDLINKSYSKHCIIMQALFIIPVKRDGNKYIF